METLLILQPRESSGSGKSSQEIILDMINGIMERKEVPGLIDLAQGNK